MENRRRATVVMSTILALGLPSTGQASQHRSAPEAHAASHPAASHPAASHAAASHAAPAASRSAAHDRTADIHAVSARTVVGRSGAGRPIVARVGRGAVHDLAYRAEAGGRSRSKHSLGKGEKAFYASAGGGISCVPFARAASGIDLKGNAANWWDAAQGVYARGERPETGSVMNFRATGHMRLGHVAVVAAVLNSRMVEIDHANWAGPGASRGGVSRGIPVIDVSEANDWSAVRVGLGRSGDFGSVYPTYGFIYDRPDRGVSFAHAGRAVSSDEVAEAPARSLR